MPNPNFSPDLKKSRLTHTDKVRIVSVEEAAIALWNLRAYL
ncbi:hypothetical protein [Nostoc sp. CHAB 5836]|nr:hypothetical protein [Nostoc sp. CHAB 5836]